MKVNIDRDEWWPVYTVGEEYTYLRDVEISDEDLLTIKQAHDAFDKAQEIVRDAIARHKGLK